MKNLRRTEHTKSYRSALNFSARTWWASPCFPVCYVRYLGKQCRQESCQEASPCSHTRWWGRSAPGCSFTLTKWPLLEVTVFKAGRLWGTVRMEVGLLGGEDGVPTETSLVMESPLADQHSAAELIFLLSPRAFWPTLPQSVTLLRTHMWRRSRRPLPRCTLSQINVTPTDRHLCLQRWASIVLTVQTLS